jgi:acyl-CoA synthetase (AMP-forming)/AMP-acid ligase II
MNLLFHRVAHDGDKPAYTFLENGEAVGETIDYADFGGRVLALAAELQQRCSPRDRVLILYPPCIEYMVGFFACLCADMVAVPLFPPRGTKHNLRLEAIARDCRPSAALFSTKRVAHKHAAISDHPELASLQFICSDTIDSEGARRWSRPRIDSETIAFLQYTSGSTGLPKGVMVSHGNLLHNQRMLQASYETDAESTIVSWLPIYHDMGLIAKMLASVWLGSHCVFMAPAAFLQRPIRWLQAISRFRGYVSGAPNFAFDLCVDKVSEAQRDGLDLSSWKVAFSGAEPIRLATLERFAKAFEPHGFSRTALQPCYGLAEGTLMVSGGSPGEPPVSKWVNKAQLTRRLIVHETAEEGQSLVGCGRSRLGQTLRIVDEVTLRPSAPNSIGEIWVAGPSVARGYWGRDELSTEIFQARIAGSDEGPFLRTGDLGFLDGEELYITGRTKDVIIVRGANHYPQDVEATIEAIDPAINPSGVAAFGINDATGERVVIVAEVARTYLRKVNVKAVTQAVCRCVLESHEILVNDVVLIRPGSLPKSSSGKVQRSQCRSLYQANQLDVITRDAEVATDAA